MFHLLMLDSSDAAVVKQSTVRSGVKHRLPQLKTFTLLFRLKQSAKSLTFTKYVLKEAKAPCQGNR